MPHFAQVQAAAADSIRCAFPSIRDQVVAHGEKLAAFFFCFVADFYAATPDGISQEDIGQQGGALQDALRTDQTKCYCTPIQPSNPDGDDWPGKQSLLYRLGWEWLDEAEKNRRSNRRRHRIRHRPRQF